MGDVNEASQPTGDTTDVVTAQASPNSVTPTPTSTPSARPTPTPSPSPVRQGATEESVQNMEISGIEGCPEAPAGTRMSGGSYEYVEDGVALWRYRVSDAGSVFVDIDDDGADEAIVAVSCDAGGHPWPQALALVDAEGRVLDSVSGAEELYATSFTVTKLEMIDGKPGFFGYADQMPLVSGTVGWKDQLYLEPNHLSDWPITFDGIGPVQIGMSAQEALEARWAVENPKAGEFCEEQYLTAEGMPGGIGLTFDDNDELHLITISDRLFQTESGARPEMSLTDLQGIYREKLKLVTEGWYAESQNNYALEYGGRSLVFALGEGDRVSKIVLVNGSLDSVYGPC